MKKFFLLIIVWLGIISTGGAQTKPSEQIDFTSRNHDFGQIKETDGIVTHVFEFKNTSDKPFIINFVSSSCGCTTPEYNKEPVMPGKTGKIKVAYDPAGRPGPFTKEVIIVSNNRQNEDIVVIKGNVVPRPKTIEEEYPVKLASGLRASSNSMSFGSIPIGYSHSKTIYLYNQSEQDVQVAAQMNPSSTASVEVNPKILKPKEKGLIVFTYDLKNQKSYSVLSDQFDLSVNGKAFDYPIRVTGTVIPDFSSLSDEERRIAPHIETQASFHHFGTTDSGKKISHTFDIDNIGGRDLIIEAVIPENDEITYTLDKKTVKPKEKASLTVTLNTAKAIDRLSRKVTLITNDLYDPVLELRVATNIN